MGKLTDIGTAIAARNEAKRGKVTLKSWLGTEYNEKLFRGAREGLVSIYLDGVVGVSPDRGEARRMVTPERADRTIAIARTNYEKLAGQKAPRSALGWYEHKVRELAGLIDKAIAVREGRMAQKMTEEDYAAYWRSLGIR
jgi:hypothetical protein